MSGKGRDHDQRRCASNFARRAEVGPSQTRINVAMNPIRVGPCTETSAAFLATWYTAFWLSAASALSSGRAP
jgi:hypothetical protein